MEYTRIVAVTGMPGLYEAISSKSDGAVVRSLEDESTKFVSSRIHNLSHLESIEVYTTGENVRLSDVFIAMKENKTQLPDLKDNKAVKKYFDTVYPNLDFDRVYASDMKKMIKWFEVLEQNKIDYTVSPETEEATVEEPAEAIQTEEPAAKKAKPKTKATASKDISEEEVEKKPKKTARKKKTEE